MNFINMQCILVVSRIIHWNCLRSGSVDKRPVDALILRTSVSEAGARVQADRVVLGRAHVLQIDALLCLDVSVSPCRQASKLSHIRGLEAVRAIRPSAMTVHCWPGELAAQVVTERGAMSFHAAASSSANIQYLVEVYLTLGTGIQA